MMNFIININDDDDDNEDTSRLSTMIAKQYRVVKVFTEHLSNSIAGNTSPIGSVELMLLIIFYIVDVVGGEGHHQLVFDE